MIPCSYFVLQRQDENNMASLHNALWVEFNDELSKLVERAMLQEKSYWIYYTKGFTSSTLKC